MHLKIIRGLKQDDILHHSVAGTLRAQPCRFIADVEEVQFIRDDKGVPFAEVTHRDGTPSSVRLDGVAVLLGDDGNGIDLFDALADPVIKLSGQTTPARGRIAQGDTIERALAAVEGEDSPHKRGPKKKSKGPTGRPPGRPRKHARPMVDPNSPMGQALDRAMGAEVDPQTGEPQISGPAEDITPPAPSGKAGNKATA